MKLFAFTLMKTPDSSIYRLSDRLTEAVKKRYKDDVVVKVGGYSNYSVIEAAGVLTRFSMDLQMDALLRLVAATTADWLIVDEEEKRLRQLIIHDYHYENEEEVKEILRYIDTELNDEAFEQMEIRMNRKNKLSQLVLTLLQESKDLNLDGFMSFRMNSYIEELKEIIEYAVDEFILERQYKEFVSLLQYFVYIQEAKIPFAHLIHKGGNEFKLLNDQMEPIDTSESNATLTMELLEKDVNFEDVIVSTLISVSPQLIYIHTREPDLQVIQTIAQIFENRVELCEYCGLCHNLDRYVVSDYNKN